MVSCMKTTLNIDDSLITDAKALAREKGSTLTALFEDAVRVYVYRAKEVGKRERVALPTFGTRGGGFVKPGIDLDDSAALLELMEEDAPMDARR